MATQPQTSVSETLNAQSFVNTIQTSGSDLWNKSNSVNFLLFMVIGFCVTLAVIALTVVAFWFVMRRRRRQRVAQELDAELALTVLEPKELYVVVHPGGAADIAYKEDNDAERKLVPKYKPIELNLACIDEDEDTIPAYRQPYKVTTSWDESFKKDGQGLSKSLGHDSDAVELEDTARFLHSGRRSYHNQYWEAQAAQSSIGGQDHSVSASAECDASLRGIAAAGGSRAGSDPDDIKGDLTARTTASEEYYEDVLLLQQRFTDRKW